MVTVDRSETTRRIVVGVDGSETSRHALRWAAEEALAHDAELNVVHAWDSPSPGAGVGLSPGRRAPAAVEEQHGAAEQLVRDATDLTAAVAPWLQADHDGLSGTVLKWPERAEIDTPVSEQLIVELYSK